MIGALMGDDEVNGIKGGIGSNNIRKLLYVGSGDIDIKNCMYM